MYPIIRLVKEFAVHRDAPALKVTGTHVSHHLCWPWDIDIFGELNNGRALTLFDLGRLVLARRTGLLKVLRHKGWLMTVAGSTIRYRRRVRMFDRLTVKSRCIGWDERFLYLEQSMWKGTVCASHVVLRMAVTDRDGIVPTARVEQALDAGEACPQLPAWVETWCAAEKQRPWPPMGDA